MPMDLFQATADPPHPVRAPQGDGPHPSKATGWAVLLGFLAFTTSALILYLVRLAEAAP
jgi:hypothetical protein